MKAGICFALAIVVAGPVYAMEPIHFKPAILNAALLFSHDPSVGPVKQSLQWIRNSEGELVATTDVRYDREGCFNRVNMVDKLNGVEFHLENKNGVLSSRNGQHISGKVNQACQITELHNDSGSYTLSYNSRGLLESMTNTKTGEVSQRFEYRFGQFPVRIREYDKQTDKVIAYPAGNPQFLDFESAIGTDKVNIWLKQSCAYRKDGNAGLCSLVTAYDENYREGATVMFSNHQTLYYQD
ncbi:YnfC family lipoprotein [Yokenella regensburgei]|uniref:YnfC family lipoprotein n=1 Tax=Yokenella regensburgei TaxID=158877 RepID=UPI001375666A|nr:YnfC family lipoprotein [Yokenella regensburgei]KAF1367525.1 YD repeat-containing protein [Yokenella regensburgei]